MLKLSRAQYKQLCADCAAEMMKGSGHGGKIPDFSGTDMKFYVKDPKLKGGGFTDTLSNTWNKVKTFVSESPLAQKVVKQGLAKGKELAKDVAGKAVQMGLEKLGVPESAMGTARSGKTCALLNTIGQCHAWKPFKHVYLMSPNNETVRKGEYGVLDDVTCLDHWPTLDYFASRPSTPARPKTRRRKSRRSSSSAERVRGTRTSR